MDFLEVIKNPAKFIFNRNKLQPSTFGEEGKEGVTSISNTPKPKKDWLWIFKGRTGLFIKISVPVLIVLSLIQPFFVKDNTGPIAPPPVIDTGDALNTPDFVSTEYSSSAFFDGKYLLYTPKFKESHKVGTRGLVLDKSTQAERNVLLPIAINTDSYVYLENGELVIYVSKILYNEQTRKDEFVENNYTIASDINSTDEIINLHLTSDNHVAYLRNNVFYVFNLEGNRLLELPVREGYSYTYFDGSTYYVRPENENYYLVRLNSSNQEVYSQNLNTLRPHTITIVNGDRFLVVYESPGEKSFFVVEMRDIGNRTIFKFTPDEKEDKLTKVERAIYNQEDTTTLLQGSNLAKLFNTSGSQLWIR